MNANDIGYLDTKRRSMIDNMTPALDDPGLRHLAEGNLAFYCLQGIEAQNPATIEVFTLAAIGLMTVLIEAHKRRKAMAEAN